MFCPQCGIENRSSAKFCNKCGARTVAQVIEAKPQSTAHSAANDMARKPVPSKPEDSNPRLGEIVAVPIIRKPGLPSAPQGKKIETKKDSEKKTTAPAVSRPPVKMPPPEKYPDASQ